MIVNDAQADGQGDPSAIYDQGIAFNDSAQAFAQYPAGWQVGILQYQGIFVSAVSERGIRGPRVGCQLSRDIPDHSVTHDMPIRVVDMLESVDIQINQAKVGLESPNPFPRKLGDGDFEQVIKMPLVVQPG